MSLKPPPSRADSLVTLELHDRKGRTELVLRHELLPDTDAAREHAKGWEGCLAGLESLLRPANPASS